MDKTITKDIGIPKTDFFELMGAGVIKYFEEQLQTKLIGNGTLTSGLIKLAEGYGVSLVGKGSIWNMLKTAVILDGTDDIVHSFMGGNVLGGLFGVKTNNSIPANM